MLTQNTIVVLGWGVSPFGIALGLLPLAVYCAITLIAASFRPDGACRLRESMLVGAVVCGAWVVAGTELLSLFGAISFWPVLVWWLFPALALGVIALYRRRRMHGLFTIPSCRWGVYVPLTSCIGLVLLAGIVAAASPPNTFDALRYHLPRQVHWIQQGSVEHFAHWDAHQLILPPFAEFMGMHLMVLSNGDFYATLVQWFALVLCCVAASAIASALGGRALAQGMAALLVATNPMAWIQASSAKNDLVAALWVLTLAYWLVALLKDHRCGWIQLMLIGTTAGLAALTKATAVIVSLPIGAVIAVWLLYRRRGASLPMGVAVIVIALAVNAGHFSRNVRMFDSLHAPTVINVYGRPLSSEVHSPATVISTLVRNMSLHTGTPWPRANATIESAVRSLHDSLGWDIDDQRTSAYDPFTVRYRPRAEEMAGAPIHLILILLMLVASPFILAPRWCTSKFETKIAPLEGAEARRVGLMIVLAVAAAIVFAAMLKWQPWHARLHVGLFALFAPVIACVLCRGRGAGALPVCAILLVTMAPTVLWSDARPILGERNIFNTSRNHLTARGHGFAVGADDVVDFVLAARVDTVGVDLWRRGGYVMQRRLLTGIQPPPRIMPPVTPLGRRMPRPWPPPDLIVSDSNKLPSLAETSTGTVLHQVRSFGPYRILATRKLAERLYQEGLIEELPEMID